ncbi:CRISPR-associated endonuclease Cas2 [Streptococcus sp. zg-86]|uniref:CRISPR-associated endoribonuclease Cas2 n=1 Tax=Streptococcus zhangguiae TaxID=2664091 RepID=A0A6I4RJS4_9STRE|nr:MULTISPECIES: CRISPR-associated endonuclease Cas2 [unclassified Streptococcus]MTB64575.1 CRISPR-associated endonuclease Cas2 [Streptococcus sp. zg-86]MTB90885.1 CRISPR-associated endonuclease Cas2 [Streptococcus sp. zg-36]MWV56691.1 CRISPR-associated endonuclease Cas2 [Streptococcus sp. zg-70]QTH48649.1 CRISPR-associated endonuclease Cas2 [Streptococcus sp. zg-86]
MFIILSYDIGQKRLNKVLKTCRKYLVHIQKSVFEGQISPSKYRQLKYELGQLIDVQVDSVIIYQLESPKFTLKEQIGVIEDNSFIL